MYLLTACEGVMTHLVPKIQGFHYSVLRNQGLKKSTHCWSLSFKGQCFISVFMVTSLFVVGRNI